MIVLLKEARSNTSSVQLDLGGGEDGCQCLVCSSEVYQDLVPDGVPYNRPDNPGRLQLEVGMTQYTIVQA